jgi:hypothetical protein
VGEAVQPSARRQLPPEPPLLQGSATAGHETAKGGAIGSKAEGPRPQEGSQGRRAAGEAREGARTVGTKAEVEEAEHKVMAGSARGRWPNTALQRIAARWRFGMKPKGRVWAARAEGCR